MYCFFAGQADPSNRNPKIDPLKVFFIVTIVFGISCKASKESAIRFNYEPYALTALEIMDSLDIPVRPKYKRDPPIKFLVKPMNKSGETQMKPARSLDSNIVYRKLKIRISPDIFRALNYQDTSDFKHLFAVGTIIHELVHVFQYPDTMATNTGSQHDLINRLEVEASSVMTYYLLSKTSPKDLSRMVLSFGENKTDLRILLNRFFYSKFFYRKKLNENQ
jgi:hypothetical protein